MKAIALATLKEAMRKKTFIVMTVLSILYLILWGVLLYYFNKTSENYTHGLGSQFKMVAAIMLTQTGLQFSSMLISLLTIMISAGSIASELENGMIHAIISRPIKRSSYVIGKLVGLAVLVFLYSTILFFAILLMGKIFSLETIALLSFSQILKGWLLYLLVPLTALCITLYGSVFIKTVPNGLLMIFLYILGNIGGMIEMIGGYINNSAVVSSGIFISLVSPFHTIYTECQRALLPSSGIMGEAMSSAGGLSGSGRPASTLMFAYICFYALIFLFLAIRKFAKTDIS